jgi:hypothetical protein
LNLARSFMHALSIPIQPNLATWVIPHRYSTQQEE